MHINGSVGDLKPELNLEGKVSCEKQKARWFASGLE